jgi:chromosome segregation ATPase
MDADQILKRVQWIDDERRKDKDTIAMLENRILALEGGLTAANQVNKDLTTELTRLTTVVTRMDQFDTALLQSRIETKKQIEELDKDIKKREEEVEKVRKVEINTLDNSLGDIRKLLDAIPHLDKGMQSRVEEEIRLSRLIDDFRMNLDELRRDEEEYMRTYRLLDDGRRQDTKRLNDMVAEVTAMRKRVDDQRAQIELVNNSLRKLESRLNELVTVEAERRDAQVDFLDRQALIQVERERTWKEWSSRFDSIEKQSTDVESHLQKLEATYRDTKRAQQSLDELGTKVERRMGEITEIQRLSEDRFRQEWVTFKADDQKRWTNYTLTQEEQRSEINRQNEKLGERVTQLEDNLQEHQDLLQQINDQTTNRLQSLLALVHDWVSSFERSSGRAL